MSDEQEKANLGATTFRVFCEQFGENIHAKILLEVLLEGLLNEETIFIFGEQEQTRDQTDHSSTESVDSDSSSIGFIHSETTTNLGAENLPNHP